MSVCQYDLACQRLLSGVIAFTTFRAVSTHVPHYNEALLDTAWTALIKGEAFFLLTFMGTGNFPLDLFLLMRLQICASACKRNTKSLFRITNQIGGFLCLPTQAYRVTATVK